MKKGLILIFMVLLLVGCGKKEENVTEIDFDKEVVVTFKDLELEKLVRETLQKEEGDITSFDMLEIYEIRIREAGVTNLEGLEYAGNLSDLTIYRETIESLEPISNLKNLTRITISYSTITELPIAFHKDVQLVNLSIIDTIISDINFVKEMNSLETITISDAGIADISPLAKATGLKSINARGNEISDISVLENMNELEVIGFQGNLIDDISPLTELPKLYSVNLSYNPVLNLKALETLPRLEEVTVYKFHDETKFLILDQVDKLIEMGIDVYHHR